MKRTEVCDAITPLQEQKHNEAEVLDQADSVGAYGYPAFCMLSTVHSASSASRLKAHWRQHGPFCVPVHLSVAGL
jgi:hypothetical protein